MYATYLSDKMKPVSIRNYLSAVWFYQKLKGCAVYSEDYVFKLTLDGIERDCNSTSTVRYPFSTEDMLKMYSLLDMKLYVDKVFWLIILLAFRCVLRISHVIDTVHSINIADVKVSGDCIRVQINTSKTDQFGRDPHVIYLQRLDGCVLCPALLVLEIAKNSRKVGKKLLVNKGKLLKYAYVNTRLKSLAASLHLPVSRVSTHSLRHGGATFLKALGLSVGDIMKKANWKSKAVYRYLHDKRSDLLQLDVIPAEFLSKLKNV